MKKILIIVGLVLVSCTENARVKHFGGTGEIDPPEGRKLVNLTWKENQIWYLTKKMRSNDTAETYQFQEESGYGMVEGTYIIREHK